MPPDRPAIRPARLLYLAVLLLTLTQAGCAALVIGTAAGAGAVGYAYYNGSISGDHKADPDRVWQETQNAVLDLKWPLLSATRGDGVGIIQSRSPNNEAIEIRVEAIPTSGGNRLAPDTRVWVRVGTWGDRELSERLQGQIAQRLQGPRQPPQPAQPPAPTLLPPTPEPPLAPGSGPPPR